MSNAYARNSDPITSHKGAQVREGVNMNESRSQLRRIAIMKGETLSAEKLAEIAGQVPKSDDGED